MGSASDAAIAGYAQSHRRTLVTRDFDFADIRNYPPGDYAGIIVLQLRDDATAAEVVRALEMFIRREDLRLRRIEPNAT
jgi:predicted nuclease of predicted toxin-antitoxin system